MTDDLLAEFLAGGRQSQYCWRTLIDLTDEQAAKVDAALAHHLIKTARISEVLGGWGHDVSTSAVGRHRRGECRCQKT